MHTGIIVHRDEGDSRLLPEQVANIVTMMTGSLTHDRRWLWKDLLQRPGVAHEPGHQFPVMGG